MSIKKLVNRADIKGINSPTKRLSWGEWFRGYMMRGESEEIMWSGEKLTLCVMHVGSNWAKKERVFWVLREKRFYYEMEVDSLNWKGEREFLLPWGLIEVIKREVIEDLEMRKKLMGGEL